MPGELHRADPVLSSENGKAEIGVMGKDPFYAKWNSYRLGAGTE